MKCVELCVSFVFGLLTLYIAVFSQADGLQQLVELYHFPQIQFSITLPIFFTISTRSLQSLDNIHSPFLCRQKGKNITAVISGH